MQQWFNKAIIHYKMGLEKNLFQLMKFVKIIMKNKIRL